MAIAKNKRGLFQVILVDPKKKEMILNALVIADTVEDVLLEVDAGKIIKDKAILIHPITIEGYTLAQFMHSAKYFPINRESMDSEYLSWNGEWRLPFTTPIFTWIHKVQSLGWIYGTGI